MADSKQADKPKNRGLINRLALNVRDGIAGIYAKSYYTRPTNVADIKDIKGRLNQSINTIVSNNMDSIGEPNISRLLSRANADLNQDKNIAKFIQDFFADSTSNEALLQAYTQNKYLSELDQEIDTICKYMPKLMEALDTKKDNILSADHFSKDYIFMANSTTLPDSTYTERIKALKDMYNLLSEVETWYMNASKYGEQFLYIVPFKRAIGKLLDQKDHNGAFGAYNNTIVGRVTESAYQILSESETGPTYTRTRPLAQAGSEYSCFIEFDQSNMLTEVVYNKYKAYKRNQINRLNSLCEQQNILIEQAVAEAIGDIIGTENHKDGFPVTNQKAKEGSISIKHSKLQNTVDPDELDLDIFDRSTSTDGLFIANKKTEDKKKSSASELNIPGCIIKKLDRVKVLPIYEEDICIGYLYLEMKDDKEFSFKSSLFDPSATMSINKDISSQVKQQDSIIDKKLTDLAVQISNIIDTKFINANVDLAKEIYVMLKHADFANNPNNRIKAVFLPAEDVVHIKFNEDPVTHRGISDLNKALFPAKIYCAMYLVNSIANMTRGYDRRVYYVKQAVDTNIAKNLLNTINQLKKCNYNIRQIENINNIIGIAGSLHDLLIPTSGGDPPIQFEIMPGQKTDAPTDMLQNLEEMAVNSTDVPLELIQARQSMDYAIHYTMTSTKFLRKCYNRQASYAKFLSVIMTKIYNYEYNNMDKLTVTLPPPMFLNVTNTNQVIQNISEYSQNLVEIYMGDSTDDALKNTYLSKIRRHYLGSYLDTDVLDRLKIEAEQESTLKPKE